MKRNSYLAIVLLCTALNVHGYIFASDPTIVRHGDGKGGPIIYFPPPHIDQTIASSTLPSSSSTTFTPFPGRHHRRRRLFDVFPYDGEESLLLWRVTLLRDIVHSFIIVEGDRSHTGKARPANAPSVFTPELLEKLFSILREGKGVNTDHGRTQYRNSVETVDEDETYANSSPQNKDNDKDIDDETYNDFILPFTPPAESRIHAVSASLRSPPPNSSREYLWFLARANEIYQRESGLMYLRKECTKTKAWREHMRNVSSSTEGKQGTNTTATSSSPPLLPTLEIYDEDMILHGDVDEVPDPRILVEWETFPTFAKIKMLFYYYNFNCVLAHPWTRTMVASMKVLNEIARPQSRQTLSYLYASDDDVAFVKSHPQLFLESFVPLEQSGVALSYARYSEPPMIPIIDGSHLKGKQRFITTTRYSSTTPTTNYDIQDFNNNIDNSLEPVPLYGGNTHIAGWHCSYFTSPERIRAKLQRFMHVEFATKEFLSYANIHRAVGTCEDLFKRIYVPMGHPDASYPLPPRAELVRQCTPEAAAAAAAREAAAAVAKRVPVYVINLPSRTDRWDAIVSAFAESTSIELIQYAASPHINDPERPFVIHGCAYSHIAAVEAAFATQASEKDNISGDGNNKDQDKKDRKKSADFVVVFEDDAMPSTTNFDGIFTEILAWCEENSDKFDVVALGLSRLHAAPEHGARDPSRPKFRAVSPRLVRVSLWSSAVAMIYNRRILPVLRTIRDSVLGFHEWYTPDAAIDFLLSHVHELESVQGESDEARVLRKAGGFVSLVAAPPIVWQAPSHSDLMGTYADYSGIYNETATGISNILAFLLENPQYPAIRILNSSVGYPDFTENGWNGGVEQETLEETSS